MHFFLWICFMNYSYGMGLKSFQQHKTASMDFQRALIHWGFSEHRVKPKRKRQSQAFKDMKG